MPRTLRFLVATGVLAAAALAPRAALAGAQTEEVPAQSVVTVLSRAISDRPAPTNWEQRVDARCCAPSTTNPCARDSTRNSCSP